MSFDRSRPGDNPPGTIFKVTREITPWQLGTAVGVAAIFVATVWFTLQAQGQQLQTVATDVKQVLAIQQLNEKTTTELQYEIRDLKRRVGDIEKVKP